jgi:hypothetical protein
VIARLIRRALRRPAPAYRGWQDLELGTYVTAPAPPDLVIEIPITLPAMPDLLPWQENLLRDRGWMVRDGMLQAHRRPEDARITICGDPAPEHEGLQVWGIPVRLVPQRLLFRRDGSITRLGYKALRRVLRKMPKGKFITVAESHAMQAENYRIHAEQLARGLFDERYPYTIEWRHEPPANTITQTTEYQCPVHGPGFVTVDYELAIVVCLTCGRPVEEVKPIHTD